MPIRLELSSIGICYSTLNAFWRTAVSLTFAIDPPADLARFRLPAGVASRLQTLLDRQDAGQPLTSDERAEAEGLVDLAELLTLLRLRAERELA
jgi:hypothetical protein